MIVKLAEFLSACPVMDGERVCVNYLDGTIGAYSLEVASGKADARQYADGGRLCRRSFVLSLRGEYGGADSINRTIARKCSDIENWIEKQSRFGMLPDLGEKTKAVSCEVVRGFMPVLTGSVDARYEAELELVFYKE